MIAMVSVEAFYVVGVLHHIPRNKMLSIDGALCSIDSSIIDSIGSIPCSYDACPIFRLHKNGIDSSHSLPNRSSHGSSSINLKSAIHYCVHEMNRRPGRAVVLAGVVVV